MPEVKPAVRVELPAFGHHAYGVDLTWVGEDGEIVAHGHVPPLRFIAAANHLARTEWGLTNIRDNEHVLLSRVLADVRHGWAVDDREMATAEGCDWWVRWGDATEATPGAFPITWLAS